MTKVKSKNSEVKFVALYSWFFPRSFSYSPEKKNTVES